ncbi:hypothetical protein ACRAWF_47185 [Streptomyces sp. L7]
MLWHLLILMVLTSAAASTETTVLTLEPHDAVDGRPGRAPRALARVHPRFRIPHVGTIAVGVIGAVVYVALNFLGHGLVLGDAVSACGVLIAFYYGPHRPHLRLGAPGRTARQGGGPLADRRPARDRRGRPARRGRLEPGAGVGSDQQRYELDPPVLLDPASAARS